MDLNKVMIIGRLTRDPESRMTSTGQNVASFSLATNLTWTDQTGQKQEKTEFHNIVAWRKLAEICTQYLKKGRRVYVEGRLQTRSWVDQNGQTKYRTEIIAENMIMLDRGNDYSGGGSQQASQEPTTEATVEAIQVDEPVQNPAPAQNQNNEEEIKLEDIPF